MSVFRAKCESCKWHGCWILTDYVAEEQAEQHMMETGHIAVVESEEL